MAVTSVIEPGAVQSDGLLSIVERYTRDDGTVAVFLSKVAPDQDLGAWAAARIATLATADQVEEIGENLFEVTTNGSLATPSFKYSTVAQNVAALRAAYALATKVQAVMMGDYLSSLTNAQLQSAFGLTSGQVTTLRANKLTPAAQAAATIRATTGA